MTFRQHDICRKPIPPEPSFPVPIIKKLEVCDQLARQPYILPGYSGHLPEWKTAVGKSRSRFTHTSPTYPFRKGVHILSDCEDYSNNKDFPLHELREYLQERSLRTKTAITGDYIPFVYEGFVPDIRDKFALQTHMIKTQAIVKLKKGLDKFFENCQECLEENMVKPNPFRPFTEAEPFKVSVSLPLVSKSEVYDLPSWTDRPAVKCIPTRPRYCYIKGYTGHKPLQKEYFGMTNGNAELFGYFEFHHHVNKKRCQLSQTTASAIAVEGALHYKLPHQGSMFYNSYALHVNPKSRLDYHKHCGCPNNNQPFEKRKGLAASREDIKNDMRRRGFLEINAFRVQN